MILFIILFPNLKEFKYNDHQKISYKNSFTQTDKSGTTTMPIQTDLSLFNHTETKAIELEEKDFEEVKESMIIKVLNRYSYDEIKELVVELLKTQIKLHICNDILEKGILSKEKSSKLQAVDLCALIEKIQELQIKDKTYIFSGLVSNEEKELKKKCPLCFQEILDIIKQHTADGKDKSTVYVVKEKLFKTLTKVGSEIYSLKNNNSNSIEKSQNDDQNNLTYFYRLDKQKAQLNNVNKISEYYDNEYLPNLTRFKIYEEDFKGEFRKDFIQSIKTMYQESQKKL